MKKIYIEVGYFFRNIVRSVKNLYRWLPIIWKDRDWDDHYIFEILKFKLQNTAHYTESRKWFVGHEHEAARIKLCIKLIGRIQEEYYTSESLDQQYHTSTYEFIPSTEHPGSYEYKSELVEDRFDEYFAKYPRSYKRVVKQLNDEEDRMRIAIWVGCIQHEKAKRLLFNILNKHIERWWE
jgi:hypothetical protein